MDLQRAYNVVCLMVGSNPENSRAWRCRQAAGGAAETCQDDYLNAKWSWEQVLQSHLRKPDQPKTAINVVYGPGNGKYDAHAAIAQQMKLLETIAETCRTASSGACRSRSRCRPAAKSNARFELSRPRR